MLRIRRICSRDEDLLVAQQECKNRFRERVYDNHIIEDAIQRTRAMSRSDLIMKPSRDKNMTPHMVSNTKNAKNS